MCVPHPKLDGIRPNSAHSAPCVQVVKHTAERLKALHAAGYVHRDLKPANVMWLPRENRWTTIDFGCVAPVRSQRMAALSVRYAAPEAVHAYRQGRAMIVDESLDAWSLGVLAYELLTGASWTGMLENKEQVCMHPSVLGHPLL